MSRRQFKVKALVINDSYSTEMIVTAFIIVMYWSLNQKQPVVLHQVWVKDIY